eukprot:4345771-Lingulodinium_polyedra.AAC.1
MIRSRAGRPHALTKSSSACSTRPSISTPGSGAHRARCSTGKMLESGAIGGQQWPCKPTPGRSAKNGPIVAALANLQHAGSRGRPGTSGTVRGRAAG